MKKIVKLSETQLKNIINKIVKEDFEDDEPKSHSGEYEMREDSIREDFEKAFTLIENIMVSIEKDHDKGVIDDDTFDNEINVFEEELNNFIEKLNNSF